MPNQRKETETNPTLDSLGTGSNDANGQDRTQNDSTLLTQAKTAASDVYDSVTEKASSAIEEQKAGLSGKLTGVADTVRRLSGTLHETEGADPVSGYAARYTDTAVEKIESIANYFDRTDLKDITRDIESYARRNPAIFMGSAFALGIMAARFLKSSPPADPTTTSAIRPTRSRPETGGGQKAQAAGSSTPGF